MAHFFIFNKNFFNLFSYFHRRIQRRHRILKDKADLCSADLPEFFFIHFQDILTLIQDLSSFKKSRWLRIQAHGTLRGYTFSTPRFTNDPQDLAGTHVKTYISHSFYDAAIGAEGK